MRVWWTFAVAGMAGLWMTGFVLVTHAAAQGQPSVTVNGKTAGETFKNVTTASLKDLSVDDFIASMGVIAADLGFDCADCHPNAGSDQVDWVFDTPRKETARRMIDMVTTINRTNFGGVQRVTCWTCHHGRDIPGTTIALDRLYSAPDSEIDDVVRPDQNQPTADQIFDKYIEALGGAQRLAGLASFVATGSSIGYAGLGGAGEFTIYAKAPNQKTTRITFNEHPDRGESTWAFSDSRGWIRTPRGLLDAYELVGGELDGARFEAQLSFPGQIKQTLTNWRSGALQAIGDRDYQVVQGIGPRNLMVTLYFDPQTGLLARMIRYSPSPIGRMPTQIDFGDYRDVGGIKFPFDYTFVWLDGRFSAKIADVKANVPIDVAVFGRPGATP